MSFLYILNVTHFSIIDKEFKRQYQKDYLLHYDCVRNQYRIPITHFSIFQFPSFESVQLSVQEAIACVIPAAPHPMSFFSKLPSWHSLYFLISPWPKGKKEMQGSRDRESNKSAKLDAASASSGQNEITVLPNLPLSFVLLTTPLRIDVVVLLPFLAFHTITHLAVLQLLAHSKNFGGYGCRGCKCNAILCTVV